MSYTQDLFSSRRNYADGNTRIGELDRIWYDPLTNTLRRGDGSTSGGIIIGFGGYIGSNVTINRATRLVTAATDTPTTNDFYIGVNRAGPVTITLPTAPNGFELIIKDESGNCATHNITIAGTIDNDAGGAVIALNNAALHFVYRSGWRIV